MNTIKIYLQPSGDLAELYKDFNLFQGEYQNKLVTVFVPTSLLAPDFYVVNENGETLAYNVAGTAVKMSITHTDASGKVKIGRKYALNYVKTLIKNNIEYALFERLCPKEFTHYQGTVEQNRVIINVVSIDLEQDPAVELETLASQNCGLEVLESQDLVNQDEIEASEADILNAKVTNLENTMLTKQDKTDNTLQTTSKSVVGAINENKGNIGINTTNISTNTQDISELDTRVAYLEEHAATPETYVGQITGSTLPTQEQLTAFVVQTLGRQPKNADVIIFIEQIAGGTDKNYKYIYSADGWNGYEIPPIESAGNGSLGLIAGTYTAGNTANLLIDIVGGEIKNIYLKDNSGNYRNAVEYTNTLNDYLTKILSGDYKVGWAVKADQDKNGNDIVDTYLTQTAGASKQYVRNYALPREFNDVNFIEANGFVDDPPTTPESGIQYTVTTSAIGSTTLCELTKQNTASFELTKKNSTSTTFYVTANRNCTVQFRLTVQIKLANIDWKVASVELSSAYNLIAGNVTKIDMGSTLNQLNADVLRLDNGDLIKLLIEIVKEDSVSTTFNLYSNDTYPSTFYLNTQAQILYTATGKLGQQPLYKVLGELNDDGFVFNIDTAEFAKNTECYFDLTANYTGSISDTTKLSLLVNGESIVLQSAYSTEPTIAELKQLGLTAENGSLAVSFKGFVLNVGGQLRVVIAEENLTEYAKHKEITTFALTGEELVSQLQGNFLRVGTIVIATTNYEDIIAGGVYKVIATESGLSYELLQGYQKDTAWGEITGVLDNQTDLKNKFDGVATDIYTINSKIPDGASPSNKLADKNFVNSSINNIAAFYITADVAGNAFETVAQLTSATTFYSGGVERTPTRNDYCIVRTDENHNNATTRYYYQNQWEFQYIVNETALTADQLESLNSGITSGKVTQISANKTNIEKEVADRTNADITLQSSITANANSITSLQENKADKTEIPTNASFTLAGLSEKSYNSLTDKPNIPEGAKLYATTGAHTDGAMTQKATSDELEKKLDASKGVIIDKAQEITGNKTFIGTSLQIAPAAGQQPTYIRVDENNNRFRVDGTWNFVYLDGNTQTIRLLGYDIAKQENIPTKTSQIENDSGFITTLPTNAVTTDTDQTIIGKKQFNGEITIANGIYNASGNNIISQPSGQTNFGNSQAKTVISTSERPIIFENSVEKKMAYYSDMPTKTSQLTNDSGFMTDSTVPSKFQPAMKTFVETIPSGSNYTPAKNGWFVFNITSWNDNSNAMCRLDNSSGIIIFSTLANSTGSMRYNNAPAGIIPVTAGRTYYVYRNNFNCQYFTD